MQIAKRVYSLAQEQNDSALMIGAYHALAGTLYFLGDFEAARQYAMRGVQIWRSGSVQSPSPKRLTRLPSVCLCYEALCEWHLGEIASSQATMAEAISLAKELNDMHGLAVALWHAVIFAYYERNPAEVERLASDLIELSTRQNFAHWLPAGEILRGWARSTSGDTAEGISWIEDGIEDWRATGAIRCVPYLLALKAEALHLADRTSEALEAIREAEALVERSRRALCGVPNCTGFAVCFSRLWVLTRPKLRLRSAKPSEPQGSRSRFHWQKRAEATYAEYRRQKARAPGGQGFRLSLW